MESMDKNNIGEDNMEITKEEFKKYEDVRISGVTNMFDVSRVQGLSGLSGEKIKQIMKEYSALKKKNL